MNQVKRRGEHFEQREHVQKKKWMAASGSRVEKGEAEWVKARMEAGQGSLDKASQAIMEVIVFTIKHGKAVEGF